MIQWIKDENGVSEHLQTEGGRVFGTVEGRAYWLRGRELEGACVAESAILMDATPKRMAADVMARAKAKVELEVFKMFRKGLETLEAPVSGMEAWSREGRQATGPSWG